MKTQLHDLAAHGDVQGVRRHLHQGGDVNETTDSGNTALMFAVKHPDVVYALLAGGADVHARNNAGQTPLHIAAERGVAPTIAALVKAGGDVNAMDVYGATALVYACEDMNVANARALLANGADPRLATHNGATAATVAMELARHNGNDELKALATDMPSAQQLQAWSQVDQIARQQIRTVDDVRAAKERDDGSLHLNGQLNHNAFLGNSEVVREMLVSGVDVNQPNAAGESPLHRVAWAVNTDMAQTLIKAGADVSATDNQGGTPLHCLARVMAGTPARVHEMASCLLDSGVDIDHRNHQGHTAEDVAKIGGNAQFAGLMKSIRESRALGAEDKLDLQMSVAQQHEQAGQGGGRRMFRA